MFNPNTYTQFPDHYADQQIQQESDIFVQNNLQLNYFNSLINGYDQRFFCVDIIDGSSPVTVRVSPNGNNIWEEPSTNIVYQVNGIAGGTCEFQLKMLTYDYCNKLIAPKASIYDGTPDRAYHADEIVIREPNNIFHFDAFEGPKETAWPRFNYDFEDWYDEWYQYWSQGFNYPYWYNFYYSSSVSGWNVSATNVDFRHTPTFIDFNYFGVNYGTASPILLGKSKSSLAGISSIMEWNVSQDSYLSPYISLFFPPNAQINYQASGFVDRGNLTNSSWFQNSDGFKIVGATFDGSNLILRPYLFSNNAAHVYYEPYVIDPNDLYQYEFVPYNYVIIPHNYSLWPWINDCSKIESIYPIFGSYNVVNGTISTSLFYYYGNYYNWWSGTYGYPYYNAQGFPYLKAGFFLTQTSPIIENFPGNFCKYTYKNAIISYGLNTGATITGPNNSYIGGKSIRFHSRGVVVDVEIFFKRKPFPDIGSIPNINNVKSFVAYPQNIRQLDYREYSIRNHVVLNNNITTIYPFVAYNSFTSYAVTQQYVNPFEGYYPKPYYPTNPLTYTYYYAYAPFEYAFNPVIWNNYSQSYVDIPFLYYDPNYENLKVPQYYEIDSIPPFVLSKAANYYYYDRLSYLYYAAYPYYIFNNYSIDGWAGNTLVQFNGQTSNMILQLYSKPFSSTYIQGGVYSRYDVEYKSSPNFKFNISTIGNASSQFYDVSVMRDKFASRGFGKGWFSVSIKNRGDLHFYDPKKNEIYYGSLNVDSTNVPSGSPISDMKIEEQYFRGNYLIDDSNRIGNTNEYMDIWWFYSSEKSYSVYQNGVYSDAKPKNLFKPFGTYYQGNLNNTDYCQDGVYMVTQEIHINGIYGTPTNTNTGFSNENYRTFDPTIEVIIGAFHISTENNSFSIVAVPVYYIPDIDWTKPYKGCMNSSLSIITQEDLVDYASYAYYPELDGLCEIYVKSTWWDDIENLVKIYGPNNQQLILNEDYDVERINGGFLLGDYKIKFKNPIGNLYNNEPTENPSRLLDGSYKVFWPISKKEILSCASFNDNYSSIYSRPVTYSPYYYLYNYSNFYNEFYLLSNNKGGVQFMNTGNGYDQFSSAQGGKKTMSNSNVVSLSPIAFYINNCVFMGTVNEGMYAFKCDILFVEKLEQNELPINPEGFNNFLTNGFYSEGGYDY